MWFLIFFLLANFIGLTAFFAALVLWRRECGNSLSWLVSRRGLGTLCVLAAGAGLVMGAQFKMVRWSPAWSPLPPENLGFLSLRATAFLVACLVLLAIGVALLVLGGPAGGSRAAHEKGPFAWSLAVALIITFAELSVFQHYSYKHNEDLYTIDRFHKLFYQSGDPWAKNRWLGVQTLQNPNDVWIHQEIISEVKPDFIVEAGTHKGGSAALWAMVLKQVNPEGRVITIDIKDQVEEAKRLPIVQERVDFLIGSSTDPGIVAEVGRRVKGKRVLVILDSDHSKDHVLNELKVYAPLVDCDSYIIVHDTYMDCDPIFKDHGPGPMEAVEEFLATNDDFVVDRSRERLLFTLHPKGYLKRVKSRT